MKLQELLVTHRRDLARFLQHQAGWLLRFEAADDLLQGLHVRVLQQAQNFEYRGREPFLAWVYQLARHHLVARRRYWSRLKRKPGALLRLTSGGTTEGHSPVDPADTATGPATFAERREQLTIAVQAMAVLLERDQELVRWASEGLDTTQVAEQLEISPEAARRARSRALERYRQAFELLAERP